MKHSDAPSSAISACAIWPPGGQGAPLVPYTEFLLYRDENASVGLQNIGGIGNLTVLPKGGTLADTFAFDTGPGNMVMDQLTARITDGKLRFDAGGQLAAQGRVHPALLNWMMQDPYLKQKPPKTSGRERYGAPYVDALQREAERLGVSPLDQLATATRFTAACIRSAIENDCSAKPEKLIVGGGGSLNPTLMRMLADCLPGVRVMRNEDLDWTATPRRPWPSLSSPMNISSSIAATSAASRARSTRWCWEK